MHAVADSTDHVDLALGDLLDHVLERLRLDDLEVQAGAQADALQQIQGDTPWLLLGVGKTQGGEGGVDHHLDLPVPGDPLAFFMGQGVEAAVEQEAGAAARPAPQDVQPFAVGDAAEGEIDQLQQARVVSGQGESEGAGRHLDEMIDLDPFLEAFGDHVVGADGIPQVDIGLPQRHCGHTGECGAVETQLSVGVELLHCANGQVMVDHGQAQAFQFVLYAQASVLSGHDNWQVVGIGQTQRKVSIVGLEGIGASQQIDLAGTQGIERLGAAGIASHLDWDAELFADQAGIVSAEAFVVGLADVDVEGRIIRARAAQHQALALVQPLSVAGGHRQRRRRAQSSGEQVAGLAVHLAQCGWRQQCDQQQAQ